jgi:hypothetical protein
VQEQGKVPEQMAPMERMDGRDRMVRLWQEGGERAEADR